MLSLRKMAILSGLSVAALIGPSVLSALPANAAGAILCSGDLCIQTISINGTNETAVVAAWANRSNFYGHFELFTPFDEDYNSPTEHWTAGGANYKFTVPLEGGNGYNATAWRQNSSTNYTEIGDVQFTINF
jgi:hypothetical protein